VTSTQVAPTQARTAALSLSGVTSGYDHTIILRDVSLEVPAGSVVALLGPNGAGKTTLLRTVSGLLLPIEGTVSMDGTDITRMPTHLRSRRGLCHIPEGRGVYRSLTVRENLGMQTTKGREAEAIERAAEAFPILGERLEQRAGTLSGGQQQMLAMARAYIADPRLILVDEASLGLAPIIVDAIFEFLARITAEGSSLLLVDQFVARALALASHAYVLNRGQIVFSGTPKELEDGDVFQQYLGEH
jgi:branched-chain amino acid transport system ATP-binding protein